MKAPHGKKWTIHDIIQNMGFHPTKANPYVMMRENLKRKCCEYIAVYVNDCILLHKAPKSLLTLSKPNVSSKLKEMKNYLMTQVE